jgi:hypothetical protein
MQSDTPRSQRNTRPVYDPEQSEEEKRFLRQAYRRLIHDTESSRVELQQPASDKLIENIRQANELLDQVKQPYEATLDSRLLVLSADIHHEKARKMRIEYGAFDVDEYITKLGSIMQQPSIQLEDMLEENTTFMDWTSLGRMASAYMRTAPTVDFM